MARYRINEAAAVLHVGPEAVRRWITTGRLPTCRDGRGSRQVEGADLAALAAVLGERATGVRYRRGPGDRLSGIVTSITPEIATVQVTIQAGPFRIVSHLTPAIAADVSLHVGQAAVINPRAVLFPDAPGATGAGTGRRPGAKLRSVLAAVTAAPLVLSATGRGRPDRRPRPVR